MTERHQSNESEMKSNILRRNHMRQCIRACVLCLAVFLLTCCRAMPSQSSYPSYVFTHSEIVLFGYSNGTSITVTDSRGQNIWRGTLNAGRHQVLQPGAGVYHIMGSQPYATLVGDPTTGAVLGFYAVDQHGQGTSKLFYTYQSQGNPGILGIGKGPKNFVIFAYQNNTKIMLKETDSGRLVWQGSLNAGEAHFAPDLERLFLTVEASHPVSALSYSDQGYYVPAESGRFIGRRFYTWAGNAGGWIHDLNIIAYADDTSVIVQDTQNKEVLWQGVLAAGRFHTVQGVNDRQIAIETSRDAAVSVSPTTSYDSKYAHMIFAQDETGAGIGKRFYYPAMAGARLEIFAYEDDAQVEVRNQIGATVFQGKLNRGQSTSFDSQHTLYTIISSHPVAALMDWGNEAGADFAPPYYAAPTATLPTVTIPSWLPWLGLGVVGLSVATGIGGLLYRLRTKPRVRPLPGPLHRTPRIGTGFRSSEAERPKPSGADVTHGRNHKH